MRKFLFALATFYLIFYIVSFLPAFGVSKQHFVKKVRRDRKRTKNNYRFL